MSGRTNGGDFRHWRGDACATGDVVDKFGLDEVGSVVVTYADNRTETLPVLGPVRLTLEGRPMVLQAVVLPPTISALVGQIPLERLDLHVDRVNRRLVPSPNSPILPLLNLK